MVVAVGRCEFTVRLILAQGWVTHNVARHAFGSPLLHATLESFARPVDSHINWLFQNGGVAWTPLNSALTFATNEHRWFVSQPLCCAAKPLHSPLLETP